MRLAPQYGRRVDLGFSLGQRREDQGDDGDVEGFGRVGEEAHRGLRNRVSGGLSKMGASQILVRATTPGRGRRLAAPENSAPR